MNGGAKFRGDKKRHNLLRATKDRKLWGTMNANVLKRQDSQKYNIRKCFY